MRNSVMAPNTTHNVVSTRANGPRRGRIAVRPTGRGSTTSQPQSVRLTSCSSRTVISVVTNAAPRQRWVPRRRAGTHAAGAAVAGPLRIPPLGSERQRLRPELGQPVRDVGAVDQHAARLDAAAREVERLQHLRALITAGGYSRSVSDTTPST